MTVPTHIERGCIVQSLLTTTELLKFMKNIEEKAFIEVGKESAYDCLAAGDIPGAKGLAAHVYKLALDQLAKEGLSYKELYTTWMADKSIHERIKTELKAGGFDYKEVFAETDRRFKFIEMQREARKLSKISEQDVGINVRDVGIC